MANVTAGEHYVRSSHRQESMIVHCW